MYPSTHLDELFKYSRPISLSTYDNNFPASCLDATDLTRLRSFIGPLEYAGVVVQAAAATLKTLTVTSGYDNDAFDLPAAAPAMTALTQLCLQECLFYSVDNIPHDFHRFLGSCVNLSSLFVYTEVPEIIEEIVKLCGKTLLELRIILPDSIPHRKSSINLRACTPRLQVLQFVFVSTFFMQPYPSTLQLLDFDCVYVWCCDDILTDLRSTVQPLSISILRLSLDRDDEEPIDEEEEEAAAITIREISNECERRGITFEINNE